MTIVNLGVRNCCIFSPHRMHGIDVAYCGAWAVCLCVTQPPSLYTKINLKAFTQGRTEHFSNDFARALELDLRT